MLGTEVMFFEVLGSENSTILYKIYSNQLPATKQYIFKYRLPKASAASTCSC